MDHKLRVYHNFIDFKKAFDRVWHEGFFECDVCIWHSQRPGKNHVITIRINKNHYARLSGKTSSINIEGRKINNLRFTDNIQRHRKEIQIRLEIAVTALVKLEKICSSNEIDFKLKYRIYNCISYFNITIRMLNLTRRI